MTYKCPKCGRYGMEWDGRAKILLCYYTNCNHVIRMGCKKEPSKEEIMQAIEQELENE